MLFKIIDHRGKEIFARMIERNEKTIVFGECTEAGEINQTSSASLIVISSKDYENQLNNNIKIISNE